MTGKARMGQPVQRRGPSRAVRFFCLFCGGRLLPRRPRGTWMCPGCHAGFVQETDPNGCVIRLTVEQCGASVCCRSGDVSSP